MDGKSLGKNYYLMDMNTKSLLNTEVGYQYNISDLDILVIYKCKDMDCLLEPEDKEKLEHQL